MIPHRLMALCLAAGFLPHARPAHGFAAKAKSTSLVEMRRRSLARVASSSGAPARRKKAHRDHAAVRQQHLSKTFLSEVLEEAQFRQRSSVDALDREVERRLAEAEEEAGDGDGTPESESNEASRDVYNRVEARRLELRDIESRIQDLRVNVQRSTGQLTQQSLELIKQQITELGHGSIFKQPQSSWKSTKAREKEFGRPQGFDGDVFYSPLGVPILVGRMGAHSDEALRNAAQGSDLWFQVEDYNGSRVLLRTSLVRGTRGSKRCRQTAADLAARYSVWGDGGHDSVPVMYTDSRKVAKRGSRIGNMKKSKSLGRILGCPRNV